MSNLSTLKTSLDNDIVKDKFTEMLGKKAPGFISSIISAVSGNEKLMEADPNTIISSAAIAASMDLPINSNLGFAYIVPYGKKAQFQMGYKGFVQLAMRTGQYKTINSTEVYEGQLKNHNHLTGMFELGDPTGPEVVGYAAYFALTNGFEKMSYMSLDQVQKHGKSYSKSFASPSSRWKQDFDAMAKKTVLKLLLSKFGVLSIEMQTAVESDQGVILDDKIEYPDNEPAKSFDDAEVIEASGLTDTPS